MEPLVLLDRRGLQDPLDKLDNLDRTAYPELLEHLV